MLQLGWTHYVLFIGCSVPQLMNNQLINWLSHESVVSSSGALILQSVNYTINGRMFTCFDDSSLLELSDSHHQWDHHSYCTRWANNSHVHSTVSLQHISAATSVSNVTIGTHHMLLMVTRMLSCSVLSHWIAPLDQTTVLSVLTGETALTLSSTTAPALSHMGTHRSVTPSLVTWH